MQKNYVSFSVWIALVLVGVAYSAPCRSGEWSWADGQMWATGMDLARPVAAEQLAYATRRDRQGDRMDAARQYYLLAEGFPGSREAGAGLLGLAKSLYEMYDFFLSYQVMEEVVRIYPESGLAPDFAAIELQIAKRLYASGIVGYPGIGCTPQEGALRKTLMVAESAIGHAPRGAVAAEAGLLKAEVLLTLGDVARAREAFVTVRDAFPLSGFTERAGAGVSRCDNLAGRGSTDAMQVNCIVEAKDLKRISSGDVFGDIMGQFMRSASPNAVRAGQEENVRDNKVTDKGTIAGIQKGEPVLPSGTIDRGDYKKRMDNMSCRYSSKPLKKDF